MDMFYASVEIRDKPELADKPVAVENNEMIVTANYIARNFGVKAGMPRFIGLNKCPDLTLVPQNMAKYMQESGVIREIFKEYDANCETHGLDEANLCVTTLLK